MRVIGTAGHVDHGKSTLVKALTGTHPDRLKEEREREMTIDLGFAFLTLASGEEIGIVDVPGHRDFIENMLSGVGGIDAALFVVAADEGVMPQTREHLAILDLLQINGGIVALTKIDLVDDPDWLDLVEEELRSTLVGTVLSAAPILRVAARTGEGVQAIPEALERLFQDRPDRPDFGNPRLPIDRVFTISGFGTVVTGTLLDGTLSVGNEVEIMPSGIKGRVRGLQSHNRKENVAGPGSRTAVNISGVSVDEVTRGSWLVAPGTYQPTRRVDLRFNMLPDASAPLKHNSEVKFFIGSAEVMGRARVLGVDTIQPGTAGWVQVELVEPVIARRSDRYIIRRPSPGETIGGGEVIDPDPSGRHKRFSKKILSRLEAFAKGDPIDVFLQAAISMGISPLREMTRSSSLDMNTVEEVLGSLFSQGDLINIDGGDVDPNAATLTAHSGNWRSTIAKITGEIQLYTKRFPLRRGMPREELRSKLKLPSNVFNAVIERLAAENIVRQVKTLIVHPDHSIRFTEDQKKRIEHLLARFTAQPYSPPTVKECIAEVGEEIMAALVDLEQVQQVSADVVFRKSDYDRMRTTVRDLIEKNGSITVGEFRDRFNTSRKYALSFLEHLDAVGLTYREGDGRKLRR